MCKERLFEKGNIVICIDPAGTMYYHAGVDQLEFGKRYKIYGYKDVPESDELFTNVYLEKWNGFSGNITQSNGNCTFRQIRFILIADLTEELIFEITKHKLGVN